MKPRPEHLISFDRAFSEAIKHPHDSQNYSGTATLTRDDIDDDLGRYVCPCGWSTKPFMFDEIERFFS